MSPTTSGAVKSIKEIVSEKYAEAMEAAVQGIGRAVRPVYIALNDGRADHIGSCVLVEIRDQRLLITAAHVIDEVKHGHLYIPAAGVTTRLEGSGAITTPPDGIRRKDKFDFAVLKIPPALAAQLGNTRFIREREFVAPTPAIGRAYMALGYPNVSNKKIDHANRKIKPSKLSFGSTVVQDEALAKNLKVSGDDHYFVKYDKRQRDPVTRSVLMAIEPKGMSGGGLFDLGQFNMASLISPPRPAGLAGILIEYHAHHNRRMVAIKIDALKETIDNVASSG